MQRQRRVLPGNADHGPRATGLDAHKELQPASAARFRCFRLTLVGLVEVGEVAEIIVNMTAYTVMKAQQHDKRVAEQLRA